MSSASPAIIAFVILIIVFFIIIISYSYSPAPVTVTVEKQLTAEEILDARRAENAIRRSNLSPNREGVESPASVNSDAYDALRRLRAAQKEIN